MQAGGWYVGQVVPGEPLPERPSPAGDRWYLVATARRPDRLVVDDLARAGVRCFAPLETIWVRRVRPGRRCAKAARRTRPLFPGYVFVVLDAAHPQFNDVLAVNGVWGFVEQDGRPLPVPIKVIDKVREMSDAGDFDRTKPWQRAPKVAGEIGFEVGDHVEVTDGAFVGFAAVILAATPGQRLMVTMQLLGAWIDVEINPKHVRAV